MSPPAVPEQAAPFHLVGQGQTQPPMSGPSTLVHVHPDHTHTQTQTMPTPASSRESNGTCSRFPWIPEIDRLSCCCNLKTCCIVQGWFMMVYSFLMIIGGGLVLNDHCRRSSGSCGGLEGSALVEYLLVILSDGIAQLLVSGLFVLGINQAHPGLLMPYVVFLHWKIITELHHGVFHYRELHCSSALTVFLLLIPLSIIWTFLMSANSLRVKMAREVASRKSQVA